MTTEDLLQAGQVVKDRWKVVSLLETKHAFFRRTGKISYRKYRKEKTKHIDKKLCKKMLQSVLVFVNIQLMSETILDIC